MLSPIFEELEKEYKNIKFVKINVDESSEVSQNFNVRSIPTVFFFKAKKNVSNFLGFRPKNEIVKIIEKVLSK
jgi:thioredoxin 1